MTAKLKHLLACAFSHKAPRYLITPLIQGMITLLLDSPKYSFSLEPELRETETVSAVQNGLFLWLYSSLLTYVPKHVNFPVSIILEKNKHF